MSGKYQRADDRSATLPPGDYRILKCGCLREESTGEIAVESPFGRIEMRGPGKLYGRHGGILVDSWGDGVTTFGAGSFT